MKIDTDLREHFATVRVVGLLNYMDANIDVVSMFPDICRRLGLFLYKHGISHYYDWGDEHAELRSAVEEAFYRYNFLPLEMYLMAHEDD